MQTDTSKSQSITHKIFSRSHLYQYSLRERSLILLFSYFLLKTGEVAEKLQSNVAEGNESFKFAQLILLPL